MVEKGIIVGVCHSVNRYAKANISIWKIIIKIRNYHCNTGT